jgi:hypothetical protein
LLYLPLARFNAPGAGKIPPGTAQPGHPTGLPGKDPMDHRLTVTELEQRWENALITTQSVVSKRPGIYSELKSLAGDVVFKPLDIKEYLPTAEKLVELLEKLDPNGRGSIFHYFHDRILPSSIWDVCWLRMECQDLLAHLKAFDKWRVENSPLKIVK